ncbi:MAG: CpsB/CapC family capsule biosynthesis tyrosine phosphatase [Wenzhouxiangellaceae bacterium]|nr:CpsB/CapC family capsule biosynthesis tyrosine phosphatase [Wenzhouxiangellaceae bacterium]
MLTDLHCHLLPGIDDGARDLEQSLAMARIAVDHGIATAVVTPHHLNGVYTNPAEGIRTATERLRTALDEAGIPLRLLPGNELHLTPETPAALRDGTGLTIADRGRAALVELPVHTVPVGAEQLLEQILELGITPVVAHPERNSELRRNPERLAEWVEMGCLGQVTAQSCSGRFGEGPREAAKTMVLAGSIHVVASDAHRDRRRIPSLEPAVEPLRRWAGNDVATLLVRKFPSDLAAGREIDRERLVAALPNRRRGLMRRLFGR